jgi:hypothetical protein
MSRVRTLIVCWDKHTDDRTVLFLSASYLMLVVFGQAYAQQPDYSLCLVQASLVYSALPL